MLNYRRSNDHAAFTDNSIDAKKGGKETQTVFMSPKKPEPEASGDAALRAEFQNVQNNLKSVLAEIIEDGSGDEEGQICKMKER